MQDTIRIPDLKTYMFNYKDNNLYLKKEEYIGNIVQKRKMVIPDIDNYSMKFDKDDIILIRNNPREYIQESELETLDFKKSKILNCMIKHNQETISDGRKFLSILKDVWGSMDREQILANTSFKVILQNNVNGNPGYIWDDKLKFAYQCKDANGTFKEIIKFVKLNKYSIECSIELQNSRIINFNL